MRVVAGSAKGHRLEVPPGRDVRPTADRVREALFSSLGARVDGARVLDLFGGSGALAVEALSRGAAAAAIVERDRRAAEVIAANLARTGLADRAELVRGDALAALRGFAARRLEFDVVFIDPPYRSDLAARALAAVAELGLLAAEGVAVVESDKRAPAPQAAGLGAYAERSYGDTRLTYLARQPGGAAPESAPG